MGLQEVAKVLNTAETRDIEEFTSLISTLKTEEVDINKYDFESYFLPYVLGEIAKTDTNTAVYIDNFLRVTKSHHIGIAVKDKDGNVIFKLPPLIADTDISKLDRIAFGTIVSKVNLYTESNPNKASALLSKVSKTIMEEFKLGETSEGYITELIKIFKTYPDRVNKVRLKNGELEKRTPEAKKEEIEEDLFDY